MIRTTLILCCLLTAATQASRAQTARAQADRARESPDPANYASMQKYLSLRIYPADIIDAHGGTDSLVTQTDLANTYTVLMLDFPGGFAPVRRSMFDQWKKNVAEVFQAAQANVDSSTPRRVSKSFSLQDTAIEVNMLVDQDYAASYALDLEHNMPDLVAEWGAVVAMPFKGLVAVFKIEKGDKLDWTRFIRLTQPFIEKSYQEQPQPISDQYFWYYHGKFTRIATYVQEGVYHIAPPEGLSNLLVQEQH
jgi:hypothetical protein